jgi:hypothetical protein
MPRSIGDGKRVILRRKQGKYHKPDNTFWTELELILGVPLPGETREKIDLVNGLYSAVGSFHTKDNTKLYKEVQMELLSWQNSTRSFARALRIRRRTETDIATRASLISSFFGTESVHRIGRMLPLKFLALNVQSALDAGNIALRELGNKNANGALNRDLWSAWVCALALIFKGQNVRVTASSTNKSAHDSPFVVAIQKLQGCLPSSVHRFNEYESLVKGLQRARRTMGDFSERTLLMILVGWGSEALTGYPGDLEKQNPAATDFEQTAQTEFERLSSRVRGSKTGKEQ